MGTAFGGTDSCSLHPSSPGKQLGAAGGPPGCSQYGANLGMLPSPQQVAAGGASAATWWLAAPGSFLRPAAPVSDVLEPAPGAAAGHPARSQSPARGSLWNVPGALRGPSIRSPEGQQMTVCLKPAIRGYLGPETTQHGPDRAAPSPPSRDTLTTPLPAGRTIYQATKLHLLGVGGEKLGPSSGGA